MTRSSLNGAGNSKAWLRGGKPTQATQIVPYREGLSDKLKKRHGQSKADYWRARALQAERRPAPLKRNDGAEFYDSDAWRHARYEALKRSNKRCELCGNEGQLHVDHIKPRSKYPNLAFRLDNLQVLCRDCNLGKSNRDEIDWRKEQSGSGP